MIGNKADLPSRQVTEQMGRELATKLGDNIPFLETSAKTSTNVETAFLTIANELVLLNEQKPRKQIDVEKEKTNVKVVDPDVKNGDSCPCS